MAEVTLRWLDGTVGSLELESDPWLVETIHMEWKHSETGEVTPLHVFRRVWVCVRTDKGRMLVPEYREEASA